MTGYPMLRWWEFALCLAFVLIGGPLIVLWMIWRDQKNERRRP